MSSNHIRDLLTLSRLRVASRDYSDDTGLRATYLELRRRLPRRWVGYVDRRRRQGRRPLAPLAGEACGDCGAWQSMASQYLVKQGDSPVACRGCGALLFNGREFDEEVTGMQPYILNDYEETAV